MRKTLFVSLLCLAACSPVYVLDVRDDLRKTAFPMPPPTQPAAGTAQVAILATPSMAFVASPTGQRVHLIAPMPERDDADVWKDRVSSDPALRTSVVVKGLGSALAERLSWHLRRQFADARIGVTQQPIAAAAA